MSHKTNLPLKKKTIIDLVGQANKGFTIIEMVLVIVLLGILSVTVAPKMFGSNGFEDHAYQAEAIATLRSIQLRAMQQTSNVDIKCHTVNITSIELTIDDGVDATDSDDKCVANNKNSTGESLNKLSVKIDSKHSVSFSPEMTFSFDGMGRPVSCLTPCEINIVGSDNLKIIIESEGFIHAE